MSEVHALKCDHCGKLEDLVEDAAAIEFLGEELVLGEMQQSPAGWYEVHQQPEKVHEADDHVMRHFCTKDCLVRFFLGMEKNGDVDDDIPDAFRRMDT